MFVLLTGAWCSIRFIFYYYSRMPVRAKRVRYDEVLEGTEYDIQCKDLDSYNIFGHRDIDMKWAAVFSEFNYVLCTLTADLVNLPFAPDPRYTFINQRTLQVCFRPAHGVANMERQLWKRMSLLHKCWNACLARILYDVNMEFRVLSVEDEPTFIDVLKTLYIVPFRRHVEQRYLLCIADVDALVL